MPPRPQDPPAPPPGGYTNIYLKNRIEERASQQAVVANLQNRAAEESRDLTEAERSSIKGIVKRLTDLDAEITELVAAEQSAQRFVEVYGGHLEARARADAARDIRARQWAEYRGGLAAGGGYEERGQFKTWGQQFVESPAFRNFNGHGASGQFTITGPWLDGAVGCFSRVEERSEGGNGGNGPGGESGNVGGNWPTGPIMPGAPFTQTGAVEWGIGQNIMATDQTSGDAELFWAGPQRWGGPTQPNIRFPLLQVIGRVPTTMGSVEFMYWHPETGMAGVVPEGELKPEAELAGEIRALPVETYAWFKGVTRQALDDIPMIRSIVDTQLRRGVIRRINYQAANALTADPNIPDAGGAGSDLLAVIRLAMAMVEDAGYTANALLLNALDWASFDVSLLGLGTTVSGQSQFWGLTPVPVPNVAQGSAYVGDLTEAVTFFDRQQTNVLMTDSHSDYFLRNKLVVLAEARGRVAVTNAAAVVKCEGDVPEMTIPFEGLSGTSAGAGVAGSRSRAAVGPSRAGGQRGAGQARPQAQPAQRPSEGG